MASNVSLSSFSSLANSIQVQSGTWSFRTHLVSCGLFLYEKDSKALRSYPNSTLRVLSSRWGRMSTLQVYAAKPGFGAKPKKKTKKPDCVPQVEGVVDPITRAQQILSRKQQNLQEDAGSIVAEDAPNIASREDVQNYNPLDEELFEQRLAEIRRTAEEQKVLAEQKKYGPIDYDAAVPTPQGGLADNLGAKIGVGVAVVVFGLIFALGDFLPSGSPDAKKSSLVEKNALTKEQTSKLQAQIKDFNDLLKTSPEDRGALEAAAVSYAELGEYDKAEQYLSKIVQKSSGDVEVLRLLAEVQNDKGDYDASVSSYRAAIRASGKKPSLTLIQGLTDTLLALKKPSEAVGELLAARTRVADNFGQIKSNARQILLPPTSSGGDSLPGTLRADAQTTSEADDEIDPVTVELLLGKAYASWTGHTGDAAAVYDGLIASYPDDYRGYLAKAVLLKGQDKKGDAERMFIQARYLAPPNSKSIVDIYSGRRPS